MGNHIIKTQLVLLAGGTGERFGGNVPKQFVKIAGKTILEHTIAQIERCGDIDSIIVVVHEKSYDYVNDLLLANHFRKVKKVVIGGKTRQESSYAGICACDDDTQNVLFHDAIRPFVSERILRDTVEALKRYGAVDVAIDCVDTIIQVNDQLIITDVPKRRYLMRGQTPQGFRMPVIREAYRCFFSDESRPEMTDDCGIINHYRVSDIGVIYGSEKNIKITHQEDIYLADKLFQMRSVDGSNAGNDNAVFKNLKNKVGVVIGASSGIGSDIVRLLSSHSCPVYGFSRKNGCDITDLNEIEKTINKVVLETGRIDYVINTAGELHIGKLETTTAEEIWAQIAVNYTGSVNLAKAVLPHLSATKGALILFTSSSYTRGRAMYSVYSSTKAAIVNFAQAIAEETAVEGIRINVINPERTDTPMRRKNFGFENKTSLLRCEDVAMASIRAVLANFTGQVIDIRREE